MPFSSRRRSFSGGGLIERSNNNNRDGFGLCFFIDEKASRCSLTRSAQSTISICAALLLFTILLFLLSTFDPGVNSSQPSLPIIGPQIEISFSKRWRVLQSTVTVHPKSADPRIMPKKEWSRSKSKLALHGMGTLFRRGTRAMNELVVAHIEEGTSLEEIRWFLRSLHRSGVTARADVVIIFPWSPIPAEMLSVIEEENKSFMKLFTSVIREASTQQTMSRASVNSSDVEKSEQVLASARLVVNKGGGEFSRHDAFKPLSTSKISPFNAGAFKKAAQERNSVEGVNEPLWGLHNSNQSVESRELFFEPVWGSIVGFEVAELNPDDALLGFLDQPPMQLRRWACYQMLLGKVRHKFKHVFLTEVRGVLILGDALSVVRKKNGLYLPLQDRTWSDPVPKEMAKPTLDNGPDIIDKQGNAGSNQTKMVIFARVYGQQLWVSLDKGEKEMKLVNSGVILGGIQPVRRLANAMMTEIVRVALQRKSRVPFPDCVLLTYLLQKSTVLGKKVMDHVHAVENPDSIVHSLEMTKQKDFFYRKKSTPYAVLHGYTHSVVRKNLISIVLDDICSSPADAVAYGDCNSVNIRHQESR